MGKHRAFDDSAFAPDADRAAVTGGLQRAPGQKLDDDTSATAQEYSPWQDSSSRMTTGRPARKPEAKKKPRPKMAPRVSAREVIFGREVPWRVIAASSAVVRRSLNCSSIKTSFWTSLPERSSATDNMPLMVSVELMQ